MSSGKSRKVYKKKNKQTSKRGLDANAALIMILGAFLLVGAGLLALWKSGQPATTSAAVEVTGKPSLKVDQEKIDYGDVKLGKTITTQFTLTNVGDKSLEFTDKPYVEVKEGC